MDVSYALKEMSRHRPIIGGAAVFLLFQCAISASLCADSPAGQDIGLDRKGKADWNLLIFTRDRTVRSVKLVLFESENVLLRKGIVGDQRLIYETSSPKVSRVMTEFLRFPLRLAIPDDDSWLNAYYGYVLGTLTIVTGTGERVLITITDCGFVLSAEKWRDQNAFFSYGVAKQIDDILFQERALRLPPNLLTVLSGEHFIAAHRKHYERITKEYEERRTGK